MPVSTRSQIFNDGQNDPISEQRIGSRLDQEDKQSVDLSLRNPHHRLKEKMRALTLLYEQQKQASAALKNESLRSEELRFATHPSVELYASCKNEEKRANVDRIMRENVIPSAAINRASVLRQPPTAYCKENMEVLKDRIQGLPFPRKGAISTTVKRKLSMGVPAVVGAKNDQEVDELRSDLEKKDTEASRILVFVRLRPMAAKEKEVGSHCCVKMLNRREVYLTEFTHENDYLRLKRLRGRHFTFDACFPETTSQHEVYSTTTAELVEAVLQGRNGTVFCYGATGAGKTYTMLGTMENPGVMVLAIKDLFTKIRQRSCDGNHAVHLSYIEVYNETVRDLLAPGRPLVLREDKQGIVAAGLTQYRAYSTDEVMALLQQGNLNRTTEPTRMNETSSRSHAILQVMVEYGVKDMAKNVINKVGKLSLIDLAGSERALATDQRTLRSLEGANINRSLLALSSCINALVEGKKHIPFRNSKLTQLLKDSLGGACNTVMIANISPSNLSFGEIQNTLHWADRAKEIKTKAADGNEEVVKLPGSESEQAKLLLELQKENRELRVQLARQQQKLLTLQAQSLAANASPTPSSVTSLLTPPSSARPPEKQKARSSFLARNCFTPNSKRRDEAGIEVHRTVKALEAELERMKKDHALQLKQKDDIIKDLSKKCEKQLGDGRGVGKEGVKKVIKRGSLRPKETSTGELISPSHRFKSPAPAAKKRSFWDITAANSPSVVTLNGRKTRSFVANQSNAAPSMLLQPGFSRQKSPLREYHCRIVEEGGGRSHSSMSYSSFHAGPASGDDWDDDEDEMTCNPHSAGVNVTSSSPPNKN